MKSWTWPAVILVAILVAAIAFFFGAAPDETTRDRVLGYFETLITFIIGTLTGAVSVSAVAYFNGRNRGFEDAKRTTQQVP
jgi:hypothetical protein